MAVTLTITPSPIGSQLTETIQSNEPEDLNDFDVFITGDGNFTLTQSNISVNNGGAVQSLEGSGCTYYAKIRPPQTAAVLTISIAQNAIPEGNPAVSQTIRISTSFPDTDADTPTLLFSHGIDHGSGGLTFTSGLAVTPTRIKLLDTRFGTLHSYAHNGTAQTSENISNRGGAIEGGLDYVNDREYLVIDRASFEGVLRVSASDLSVIERYQNFPSSINRNSHIRKRVMHTRLGIVQVDVGNFYVLPYEHTTSTTTTQFSRRNRDSAVAHTDDLIFSNSYLYHINADDEIAFLKRINTGASSLRGSACYRDTLYLLTNTDVLTLDIRKYRPMAKNTKTTIYPVFLKNGDTLDLTQYAPDAERIIFDTGFDKPAYLSINTSNVLSVANNAVTETTPILVKLRGLNRIDSIAFSFYLIIEPSETPTWREIDELTLRANTTFNLFDIVENADSITGASLPTGGSLSNGKFTVGTEGGTPRFIATNPNGSTPLDLPIEVVQRGNVDDYSDTFRDRVEIGGIDVTDDVKVFPSVEVSLDVGANINEYIVNETTVVLRSDQSNAYKYNKRVANNFWQTNNLNLGGFGETIKIFIESLVDGSYVESLLFSGIILQSLEQFARTQVSVVGVDASKALEAPIRGFGTLTKWDALRQQSDEATYRGVYIPETALSPIQLYTGEAWSDRAKLTLRDLQLSRVEIAPENEAFLTTTALETAGGFLDDAPVLKFLATHRAEDVRFLFKQLALNQDVYQVLINLPTRERETPFVLNRGSVPYSVENTRNTRLLTDWVYNPTHERILDVLSNPESHIADLLVEYDVDDDAYRTLHTFSKDIVVHRIERRDATNYYLLTSAPITQDRSAPTLPRQADRAAFAFDAVAEGSAIKIHHYNATTGALTEHVPHTNARPPQLGVHYHAGFENDLQVDTFEGITPHYRGAFKWRSGNLYYRYATDSEFGVARVNASGTTTEMIDQATGEYHNHLNFAFDVLDSNGTIYFVYATGNESLSTLTIKRRTSAGVEATVLSETRGVGDFGDVGLDFGAFLGCYEALFFSNHLYMLCPIEKINFGDDVQSTINPDVHIEQLTAEKSGERNVTTATNLNPTNFTVAPGDDIPLRIDFDGTVSGATQNDLTVYGGTIVSFSISSDMIDVTIRPNAKTRHKNIIIDLAENAVNQTNEAWRITIDFGTGRSREKSAGLALYRCNVTAASPTLTLIKTYDYVQRSACNLTVHNNAVHFIEFPPVLERFKPYNPDLDGYWTDSAETETEGYNVLPDPIGALKRIESNDSITALNNVWYEERPFNVIATRLLSIDGALHISAGYGDPQELLRYNSLASQPDNFQHLVYGKKIDYVLPTFDVNQNIYDAFVDLARKVNATFDIENDIITIAKRTQRTALADGATGTSTGDLNYDTEMGTLPTTGHLLIENELIGYTGKTASAFTGITRGVLGTDVVSHADNTKIVFVDYVIRNSELSSAITAQEDNTKIYNVIRDTDNNFEKSDADSIAAYRRLSLPLNLGLTHHEGAWQESVFAETLETFKDPHDLLRFRVKPAFYINGGDVVAIHYGGLVYGLQVVSAEYTETYTELIGRTV